EGAQVAGRAMLDAEDQVKVVVVLNDHSRTHLGCWNCHGLNLLLEKLILIGESCLLLAGSSETDGRPPAQERPQRRTLDFTAILWKSAARGIAQISRGCSALRTTFAPRSFSK